MTENPVCALAPPIVFLGFMAAMGPLSLSIHVKSIPQIAASLDAPYASSKPTVSAFLLTFAVSQLIVGRLSDRFGRSPFPVILGGSRAPTGHRGHVVGHCSL
tara:strand:+ start:30 stop:335 length:306 start_codon:yes stop_codon:yes gene_type:complete